MGARESIRSIIATRGGVTYSPSGHAPVPVKQIGRRLVVNKIDNLSGITDQGRAKIEISCVKMISCVAAA